MKNKNSKLDDPIAIRRMAMDMLAIREHSFVELNRKLLQKGAAPELIPPILTQLSQDNLLCEQRYLESYIRKRANAGYGPIRIKEELKHRGITSSVIQEGLKEAGFDWEEQLLSVWQRKFSPPIDAKEKAKQSRFLIYRGFAIESVMQLLNKRSH